jgi:hypothetical protein
MMTIIFKMNGVIIYAPTALYYLWWLMCACTRRELPSKLIITYGVVQAVSFLVW